MENVKRLYALSFSETSVVHCSQFQLDKKWNQIDKTTFSSIKTFVKESDKNIDLLIIPPKRQNSVVVITNGLSKILIDFYLFQKDKLAEIQESIDSYGNVKLVMNESEINPVLRKIFQIKPQIVFINLLNGYYNRMHEQNLKNVLALPGYNSKTTIEQIL